MEAIFVERERDCSETKPLWLDLHLRSPRLCLTSETRWNRWLVRRATGSRSRNGSRTVYKTKRWRSRLGVQL